MKALVVACSQGVFFGKALAKNLGADYSALATDFFPDGEMRLRFNTDVKGRKVILVQSMHPSPNDSLLEFLFAIETAKELGAVKVFAVAPYLAYARQDVQFNPGEVVSNKIVAGMIERAHADAFFTVTTHLHRISTLKQIFKRIPAVNVLVNSDIAAYARSKKMDDLLVVGPDWESGPLVQEIASQLHSDAYVFKKQRLSGTRVKNFQTAGLDCKGKNVLLVDDMASTGNTLISVAKILKRHGAKSVDCVAVHLLDEDGGVKVLKAGNGISSIASSNTIQTNFCKIDASKQTAREMKRFL